jgi:hypothetical protein
MKAVTLNALDTPPALRDDLPTPTLRASSVALRPRCSHHRQRNLEPLWSPAVATGGTVTMGCGDQWPYVQGSSTWTGT